MIAENLPDSWIWTTLGEIRRDDSKGINPSQTPEESFELYSVPSFSTGTPELVKGCEVGSSKQTVEPGTVLLSKINPRINRVWVVGDYSLHKKIASTEWIPFFPSAVVDSGYLDYYLRRHHLRNYLASQASGVGGSLMRIRPTTLEDYPLPIPPFAEQRRIVAEIERHFSRLDAAVAALERARARLKRYRSSLLDAACSGRLTSQDVAPLQTNSDPIDTGVRVLADVLSMRGARADTGRTELAPKSSIRRVRSVEPVGSDSSILPTLPAGWCWTTLGQLLKRLRNGVSTVPNASHGTPILRISAVRPMSVNLRDIRYLSGDSRAYADYFLQPGDLLFTRYNGNPAFVGVCGVVPDHDGVIVHPDKLIRGELASNRTVPGFIALAVNSGASRAFLAARVRTTAGQSGISGSDLHSTPIPLPSTRDQARIVAEVGRCLSIADQMEASLTLALRRAERLRQSILKRAFEGHLVSQNPADEPASILLERIRRERADNEDTPRSTRKPGSLNGTVQRRRITVDEPSYQVPTFSSHRAVAESPADYQQTSFTEENR